MKPEIVVIAMIGLMVCVALIAGLVLESEKEVHIEGTVVDRYGKTWGHTSILIVEDEDGTIYKIQPADDLYYKYKKGDLFDENVGTWDVTEI